jgi:hypothetical protein
MALARAAAWSPTALLAALASTLCVADPASAALPPRLIIAPAAGCSLLSPYSSNAFLYASGCGSGTLTLGFNGSLNLVSSNILDPGLKRFPKTVPRGSKVGYLLTAPPGLTITGVTVGPELLTNIYDGRGWSAFSYWRGGLAPLHVDGSAFDALASDQAINSDFWGIELRCYAARCNSPGRVDLNDILVRWTEAQAPSIAEPGANNLWNQTSRWIWNTPGDAWPLNISDKERDSFRSRF